MSQFFDVQNQGTAIKRNLPHELCPATCCIPCKCGDSKGVSTVGQAKLSHHTLRRGQGEVQRQVAFMSAVEALPLHLELCHTPCLGTQRKNEGLVVRQLGQEQPECEREGRGKE
jgi:hypothetical protein